MSRFFQRVVSVWLICAIVAAFSPVEAAHAAHPQLSWHRYDEGMTLAMKENKPALIYFFATWCDYCKRMENEVFPDRNVYDLLQKFVLIRVEVDSNRVINEAGKTMTEEKLARMLGVSGTPTFWFREPDGKEIAQMPGFVDREKFSGILQYISEGAYKKMRFSDYLKRWEQGK